MLTPLKSISLLSESMAKKVEPTKKIDLFLVFSTSRLLLLDFMLFLDRNQLDRDRFEPNLTSAYVNETLNKTVLLFNLQSNM